MSGRCSGVQQRIREIVPQAVYVHCLAHRLNFVIVRPGSNERCTCC